MEFTDMTKASALYNFFSSFGIEAYEETLVPTGEEAPKFPYLTYQLVTDSFDNEVIIPVSLWYRSEASLLALNSKTEEISQRIGRGGVFLDCDGGKIWIKRGSPFAQTMSDPEDNTIRRKYINITAEFLTAD
jgi:hypothetical protein